MKIVSFRDGLGNQMFQYAFAKALEYKIKNTVYFRKDHCDKKITREFFLHNFNIDIKLATDDEFLNVVYEKSFLYDIVKLFSKKLSLYVKRKMIIGNTIKEVDACVFNENLFNSPNNDVCYVDSYYCSEKYFINIRNKLLEDFTLKTQLTKNNENILEKIKNTNSVSVHFRMGDYRKFPQYGILPYEYYKNAIKHIVANVEKPHFFLFSNEPEWLKKNIGMAFDYTIVDINDEDHGYYDMWLMKYCKHNIIANSTFSWWGAWLNENPNKIVAAPKKWFLGLPDKRVDDLIPDTWSKFEV